MEGKSSSSTATTATAATATTTTTTTTVLLLLRVPSLTGRLAAHVLNYVPSPPNVVYSAGYGRQPLWYCSRGCCHAPHMYEEWW